MLAAARNGNHIERTLRWAKLILSIVGIVGGWALALTVWLVSMHADVRQLKIDHGAMHKAIEVIDERGSRALETLRNRQNDVILTNQAQDKRIEELTNKLNDVNNKQIENRYLLEQSIEVLRKYGLMGPPTPSRYYPFPSQNPNQNQKLPDGTLPQLRVPPP